MKFGTLARPVSVAAVGALLSMSLVACGGGGGGDATTAAPQGKPAGSTSAAGTSASGSNGSSSAQEIKISLTDNKFTPNTFEVPVGKEVKFELKNEGVAIHNMHILSEKAEGKDFSSDPMVQPGKEASFTAKFAKAGTYDFQCDYHLPDMSGKITVK